ncbi:MAG: glycosyltransferase family 2 protein [Bacteroidales bacterium]|nr:glycosyltransferase family 2 protein [Bacteroidales bacterium]
MELKKLGVIILNWNGRKLLEEFLPIAVRYTLNENVDLVVADNGSTDGSPDWIETNFPQVRLIRFDRNYGFAEGYNRAIESTRYPYTILLNSDVEVTEDWWRPLLQTMESNPDIGACQPKIRSYKERDKFEYAGAAGGYLDRLGYPYCRGRLFDSIETDHGQYDSELSDIAWASGAALMVRTSAYLEVGGLDADFFAHMEEIDLCCRMYRGGWRVVADPRSFVYHVGGASLSQGNPQKTFLNFRNNLLLLHKNLPKAKGRRILFLRRLADSLAWLMFVAKLDFANARAIIRAHNDFRRMRKKYTDLPASDYLSTLPGADRLIVVDRFLLRKKK